MRRGSCDESCAKLFQTSAKRLRKRLCGTVLGSDPGTCLRRTGSAAVRVTVCDVAPRDGLQNDPKILEPAVRAELVNRLAGAGLPRIEAVSFVSPARVPQMAGAEEVVAAIERRPGVVYAGLALNERGYDRLPAPRPHEGPFPLPTTPALP